jgi:hypothetical protein
VGPEPKTPGQKPKDPRDVQIEQLSRIAAPSKGPFRNRNLKFSQDFTSIRLPATKSPSACQERLSIFPNFYLRKCETSTVTPAKPGNFP